MKNGKVNQSPEGLSEHHNETDFEMQKTAIAGSSVQGSSNIPMKKKTSFKGEIKADYVQHVDLHDDHDHHDDHGSFRPSLANLHNGNEPMQFYMLDAAAITGGQASV